MSPQEEIREPVSVEVVPGIAVYIEQSWLHFYSPAQKL